MANWKDRQKHESRYTAYYSGKDVAGAVLYKCTNIVY
jgi:hypothetical protein